MAFTPDQTAPDSGSSTLGLQSHSITPGHEYDLAGPNNRIADKLRQAANINTTGAVGPRVRNFGSGFIGGFTETIGAFDVIGVVPEPSTIVIFGVGLIGLILCRRRA